MKYLWKRRPPYQSIPVALSGGNYPAQLIINLNFNAMNEIREISEVKILACKKLFDRVTGRKFFKAMIEHEGKTQEILLNDKVESGQECKLTRTVRNRKTYWDLWV